MQKRGVEPRASNISPARIEEVAGECKKMYSRTRRMLTGQVKYSLNTKRWDSCFEKLAVVVLEQEINVAQYIQAQFAVMYPSYPGPNHLHTPKAQDRYKSWLGQVTKEAGQTSSSDGEQPASFLTELHRRFQSEAHYILTRSKLGVPLRKIISYKGSPISVLTRYCIASSHKMDDLVDIFKSMARAQLALHPEYYDIYGSLIPREDVTNKRA